jgi:MFS family permease
VKSFKDKVRDSLRYSFWDGAFCSMMIGFTQDYFVPFMLLLKGTVKEVALLNALPNLLSAFIQLRSADLTELVRSRKKVVNFFVFLQAFLLIPMAAMAMAKNVPPWIFILNVTLFTASGAITVAAWGSMMSDLVPSQKRGKYFGWRNRVTGFVLIGASFAAGFMLNVLKRWDVFLGFAVIFIFAAAFRFVSWRYLEKMYEPRTEYKKEHYFSLLAFVMGIRKRNFARFVLYIAALNFAVNTMSPFFSVFMLKELGFGYILYICVVVTAPLVVYTTMSRWGILADKAGNLKVIKFVTPIVACLPFLWMINHTPFWLFVWQIVSGFAWGGLNLSATNYVYDAVTPGKRTRCLAYFNAFNGVALCLGALTGGFIQGALPPMFGSRLISLMFLSGMLRVAVVSFVPGILKLKEVRHVANVGGKEMFFGMIGLKPIE